MLSPSGALTPALSHREREKTQKAVHRTALLFILRADALLQTGKYLWPQTRSETTRCPPSGC